MPEFYLIPKRLARKAPRLAAAAQTIEAGLFRSTFWLMRRMSIDTSLWLSGLMFSLIGPFSSKAAKARENLAIAFPDKTEEWRRKTTRQICKYIGISLAELIKLDQIWEERETRLEYVIEPEARKRMENRKPSIFLTAHVGAWQIASLVTREFNMDICTVYAPESNPFMNDLMLALRQSFGRDLISTEDSPRRFIQELRAGNSIVMAMDTRPDAGKLIPFFGRKALTSTSPPGLALKTGAALMLGRGERLPGGRYRITIYDPLISPSPDESVKEQAAALTEIIYSHFEKWISEYPEQWLCLKRRWPKAHKL
ncbi:MAG: lysophospholipid acyltransferase family protein [Halioglobus sp.]|nr:lysophospholipid acyltransferase family protein [Halioglobus sp.]